MTLRAKRQTNVDIAPAARYAYALLSQIIRSTIHEARAPRGVKTTVILAWNFKAFQTALWALLQFGAVYEIIGEAKSKQMGQSPAVSPKTTAATKTSIRALPPTESYASVNKSK